MKRKLLSVLLTFCLAFSLLPTAALAEGEGAPAPAEVPAAAGIVLPEAADGVITLDNGAYVMSGDTTATIKVPNGKNATLDLNGKTLTNKTGEHTIIAENGATLTITGNGIVDNVSHGKAAVYNEGTVTLAGGTFKRSVEKGTYSPYSGNGNSWYTIANYGTMEINTGVTVENAGGYSSMIRNGSDRVTANCYLTIKGGNFAGGINTVKNDRFGVLTINGGNFSNTAQYVIMNWNKAEITAGTFQTLDTASAVLFTSAYDSDANTVGNLTISGGEFKRASDTQEMIVDHYDASNSGTATVTGGKFDADISKYIPTDYVQSADGTVEKLGETNAVAKVGGTYYKTLADAVAAAQDGDTITLLKDTIGSGIGTYKDPKKDLQGNDQIAAKGFTIDFNQHTYSVDKPAVGSKTYETQGFHLEWKGSVGTTPNITLKNGTLNVAEQHDPNLKLLIQNYCNLTLDNMTVDGTNLTKGWGNYTYVTSNCNGTVKIKDTTIISKDPTLDFAFDVDGDHANRPYGAVSLTIEGNSNISGRFEFNTNKGGNTLSISGGYFTSDPSSYKAADRYVVASDVDGYTYMVTATAPTDDQKITVVDKTNASVDPSITGNDKTAIDSAMNSGKTNVDGVAEAVSTTVKTGIVNDAKNKADNVPTGEVTSTEIEVKVNVSVTEANLSEGSMTFKAEPVANVKVNGTELRDSENKPVEVPVSNAMLNGKPITVKLPLPTVDGKLFTPKQIKHTSSDGSVEYFLDTQKTGAKTFEIKDGCAVFTITKFSKFELSGVVTYVEPSYYSSGSSSDPTYSVSTPSKTEHGTVTVSPKSASKGDTVTVTVKPDSGYVLETLTVTDKNGNELTLKDKGNGKYTFTMPAGKVEVKATFMEDNSMLNFFYDVPNNAYFYEAVKWAVENGITTGVGNDLFAPEQPCTRAQIVTFLWRAAGSPEPKGTEAGMTDVVSGSYYEKAVAWAIENGVTTGTTATTFSPDATCTRAQAVTFLARALNAKASGKAEFSDVPTDSYFAEAVAWAAANGVTEGVGGGKFAPDNDCTRGQIVTFLFRAYNK